MSNAGGACRHAGVHACVESVWRCVRRRGASARHTVGGTIVIVITVAVLLFTIVVIIVIIITIIIIIIIIMMMCIMIFCIERNVQCRTLHKCKTKRQCTERITQHPQRLDIWVHLFAIMVGLGNYPLCMQTCVRNIICIIFSAYSSFTACFLARACSATFREPCFWR